MWTSHIGEWSPLQSKWYLPQEPLCKVSLWRDTQDKPKSSIMLRKRWLSIFSLLKKLVGELVREPNYTCSNRPTEPELMVFWFESAHDASLHLNSRRVPKFLYCSFFYVCLILTQLSWNSCYNIYIIRYFQLNWICTGNVQVHIIFFLV